MRHHRTLAAVLTAAFLALAAAAGAGADEAAEAREKTRQLLAYGIDSQVLDVVARLRASRDTGFAAELSALLAASRSADVRKAVLEMYKQALGMQ